MDVEQFDNVFSMIVFYVLQARKAQGRRCQKMRVRGFSPKLDDGRRDLASFFLWSRICFENHGWISWQCSFPYLS